MEREGLSSTAASAESMPVVCRYRWTRSSRSVIDSRFSLSMPMSEAVTTLNRDTPGIVTGHAVCRDQTTVLTRLLHTL